jgi:hypothetical protein
MQLHQDSTTIICKICLHDISIFVLGPVCRICPVHKMSDDDMDLSEGPGSPNSVPPQDQQFYRPDDENGEYYSCSEDYEDEDEDEEEPRDPGTDAEAGRGPRGEAVEFEDERVAQPKQFGLAAFLPRVSRDQHLKNVAAAPRTVTGKRKTLEEVQAEKKQKKRDQGAARGRRHRAKHAKPKKQKQAADILLGSAELVFAAETQQQRHGSGDIDDLLDELLADNSDEPTPEKRRRGRPQGSRTKQRAHHPPLAKPMKKKHKVLSSHAECCSLCLAQQPCKMNLSN